MKTNFYENLRQHQIDALNALLEVDRIFTENNIPYFLLAGSALGAVRHKGFIPWDDDIDLGIFYKDKEKAYELLHKNLKEPYTWKERSIDSKYPRLYGKVVKERTGLIDVFIIVKTSDKSIERKIQWASRKVLFKLYKAKIGYHNHNEDCNFVEIGKLKIAKLVSFFVRKKWIDKKIEENEHRFEHYDNNAFYLNLYSAYSLDKELIKTEWVEKLSKIRFEGHCFPTVCDTDSYLKHLYGDYMKIPKEEDRVLRHEEYF